MSFYRDAHLVRAVGVYQPRASALGRSWAQRMICHLPAALLLLFSGWSGTFVTGVESHWVIAGHLVLLVFVGVFGSLWDPLRLGRGRLLLLALAVSLIVSHLASPVTRAGRLAIILLPAFVLLPSAVAQCWSDAAARRMGLRSLSLVVILVSGCSLAGWWLLGTDGASLPLGHHNLLAAWLMVLLPLAVMPWRDGGVGRLLAVIAGVSGLASLLATRSLGGALAALVVAIAWSLRGRWRWPTLAGVALLLGTQIPRLSAIFAGSDVSVAARWSYLEAAWRGWMERPMLGWGPGAARWTLGEHLWPIPGVHPPDQIVADAHSLPLQVGYELGWSGLLLIAGSALTLGWRRPRQVVDAAMRQAAYVGLLGWVVVACVGRPLEVAAVPLAALVGLGAMFAAEAPTVQTRTRREMVASAVAAGVMALLVLPLDLAHLAYDRAAGAESADQRVHHLRRAVRLDSAFPLYRARLSWLESEDHPGIALRARAAALDAYGVAPLWLTAGRLGQVSGESWSRDALLRACDLSPLGAIAPFHLALDQGPGALSAHWAARALLAEPMLLAAMAWNDYPQVLEGAIAEIDGLDDLDAGWREWLTSLHDAGRPSVGTVRVLVLRMDAAGADSASLHAFRRQAWPADLARIEINEAMLEEIDLGAGLPPTAAPILQGDFCGLSGADSSRE